MYINLSSYPLRSLLILSFFVQEKYVYQRQRSVRLERTSRELYNFKIKLIGLTGRAMKEFLGKYLSSIEPVLSHTEKSCIASVCGQFSTNSKMKIHNINSS